MFSALLVKKVQKPKAKKAKKANKEKEIQRNTEMEELPISGKPEGATSKEGKAAKKGRKMPSRNLLPLVVKPEHEFAVAAISGKRLAIIFCAWHVDHMYCIAGLELLKGDKKYVVVNLGIEVPDVLTKEIINKAKKNGGRIRQASFGKKSDGKRRMLLPEGFSADWKALKSLMHDLRTNLDAGFLRLVNVAVRCNILLYSVIFCCTVQFFSL